MHDPVTGAPTRILCSIYVDDGRTWDNCTAVADAFLELHENFEQFLLRELKILFDSPEDYFNLLLRSLPRETIR